MKKLIAAIGLTAALLSAATDAPTRLNRRRRSIQGSDGHAPINRSRRTCWQRRTASWSFLD